MEDILTQAVTQLIRSEPFFANLILNMTRNYVYNIPTLGVNVTDTVNLYVNPHFWNSLGTLEQVDVLKHECLFRDSLIDTNKGKLKIKDIVDKKLPVKVLSISPTGKTEYKKIIEYSKKQHKNYPNKKWVSLKYTTNPFLYSTVICTNDHRIAYIENLLEPKIKYIEAEQSLGLYSIRKVNTKRTLNKENPSYNTDQISVILGCLLGDSSVNKHGVFVSVGSLRYKDYTIYKQRVLGGRLEKSYSGYKKAYSNLRLVHGVTEQSKYLRELLYIDGKKTVKNIINKIDARSLAFWFMDDGSWNGYGSSFLHTEGFSYSDQELIQQQLKSKFDLDTEIKQRSRKPDLYFIKFKKEFTEKLFKIIAPYMHKSMKHKIDTKYHKYFGTKIINNKHLDCSIKKITEVKYVNKKSDLYDIAVEDNHNFFANNTLVHNCYHVINNHFARFKDIEPTMFTDKRELKQVVEDMLKAGTLNQAADAAINEYLPNLLKNFNLFDKDGNKVVGEDGKIIEANPVTVEAIKKLIPETQHKQHMEYYYELLNRERQKQQNQAGNGGGKGKNGKNKGNGTLLDDHGLWAQGSDDVEYVTEKVKQVVNRALEESGGREAGNIPGDVLSLIDRLNYKPKDWRSDLQRFVSRTSEILIETSRKIRNRRYGIIYPGNKTFPKLVLAVIVDTSGSVCDEALAQCFAEIDRISKNNTKVIVIECDAEVQAVYDFDPKKKIEIHGRGGTMFGPGIKKAEELDCDGILFVTDGCNFEGDSLKKPKLPILWVLYENCKVSYPWGARTEIKINKKH